MAIKLHTAPLAYLFGGRPRTKLYHYTTTAGLLGIAKSKTLWATSMHYLNDASELTYCVQRISQHFSARKKRRARNKDDEKYCDAFQVATSDNVRYRTDGRLYVVCFSAHGDSLSQWRAYGHPGTGFSLGFDDCKLMQAAQEQNYTLAQCLYEVTEQNKALRQLVDSYVERCLKQKQGTIKEDLEWIDTDLQNWLYGKGNEANFASILSDFWDDLLHIAPIFKHTAFRDEQEWRLISPKREHAMRLEGLDFRASDNLIIPYTHFYLPTKELAGRNAPIVEEIIVGPTQDQEGNKRAAGQLLLSKGFAGSNLSSSKAPFRNS